MILNIEVSELLAKVMTLACNTIVVPCQRSIFIRLALVSRTAPSKLFICLIQSRLLASDLRRTHLVKLLKIVDSLIHSS